MYDEEYMDVVEQGPDGAENFDALEEDLLGVSAPAGGGDDEPEVEESGETGSDGEEDLPDESDAGEEGTEEVGPAVEASDETEEGTGREDDASQEDVAGGVDDADTESGEDVPAPEEGKRLSLTEFLFLSKKIRELESTIRTVALSIEDSADTVDRVNRGMKQVLDSVGKVGQVMDDKISDFQNGTETWGADMNRVAGNVRKACEDSRDFLNEDLKREMKKAQEEIVRSTIDRVKTETTTLLADTRDDYEELLDQVVTNYKQFCKASSQHQKDLKKGYFDEVKQLRRILYGVVAAQFVIFALLVVVFMFKW